MGLRSALAALPDDRDTREAVRSTLLFLVGHQGEAVDEARIARATSLDPDRLRPVLEALDHAFVIDCGVGSDPDSCTYAPDPVLALEVRRFLQAAGVPQQRLQRGVDRFRGRFGSSA